MTAAPAGRGRRIGEELADGCWDLLAAHVPSTSTMLQRFKVDMRPSPSMGVEGSGDALRYDPRLSTGELLKEDRHEAAVEGPEVNRGNRPLSPCFWDAAHASTKATGKSSAP